MNKLISFFFGSYIKRYHELLRRTTNLEIILNTLLLDSQWYDEPENYFNGQLKRQEIFKEIITSFKISEVIETGTFIGRTTGFFASQLPEAIIHSCELSPQFHALAKQRLKNFNNISLVCADSRTFLNNLKEVLPSEESNVTFVYLDAHWHADLPLKGELEILVSKRCNAIIMIDDFEVLGDSGYNFDDYGSGNRLAFSDYKRIFDKLGYLAYSPSVHSSFETGSKKRGSVILALNGSLTDSLDGFKTIKRSIN
jgi:predicted O-methyltransferase YrrM